ncbi:MAG: hypothetical protein A3H71_01610 [Candidatus Sungbacteria bacterium RIFCSPLOWO2_02_FULL_48_13b]|uniref:glucose-6-phosphate isomerase n=2 Tax=Candidatus Sungiibacteriota TaxID=1817917 RepID=A0A1G2LG32_9BACT|nr:MAG: hypothetical protein A3C12_02280 [Candidatus Sungbacteria bacterium RIFCSPHIGHO2_02_FULL_49_20]OHA10566.1 MAG: hypothetical protein A3H71_01610 [Candidatus Sungbacteria bacterium RIFCSPLOWO2_02_FULL_48_13b]
MTDLKQKSGLPLQLDEAMELAFPHELMVKDRSARTLESMIPYLEPLKSTGDLPIYRVFRDVLLAKDREILSPTGLKYDITIIAPGVFQLQDNREEFFRTAGHYHKRDSAGAKLPEVYEVISGEAQWLIQRYTDDPANIEEIYLIEGTPGDKVCIPPGFGHITINVAPGVLVISNIIAKSCEYDYAPFQYLKGGGFRLLASTYPDMVEIERNGNYQSVPSLSKLKPRKDWYNGYFETLYSVLASNPERFKFLTEPETYNPDFFSIKKLYQEIT